LLLTSLSGLIGHLKTHFLPMYRLYLLLKSRKTPPTADELRIAQGEKVLDATTAAQYSVQLEQASVSIVDTFNKQVTKAFGEWNQAKFEELLTQWLVACDQPFEEVERPEFKALLDYTHGGSPLHIPGRLAIKRRIMKMGEDTIQGVKDMIGVSRYRAELTQTLIDMTES